MGGKVSGKGFSAARWHVGLVQNQCQTTLVQSTRYKTVGF